MGNLKKESGITLIALVVTIIVLLILAGVSIQMIAGESGILTQAKRAKEETERATEEEQRKLAMLEATTNLENTTYKGVTIPAGFAPTKIEGEDTVKEGLVIIDENGNEFVWIEVPKNNDIYKRTTVNVTNFDGNFYINIEDDLKDYVKEYREARYAKVEVTTSDNWQENCKLDENKYIALKNSMLKSIYINEGFWIGRYETGYEGEIRYNTNKNWNEEVNKNPVIKEGAYPLNYICYPQAQKLSNNITLV